MSKSTQEFILIIAGILAFTFVVWFISKLIEAITHPSVVWFAIGFISCLAIEGLVLLGFYIKKRWSDWFPRV